MSIFNQRYKISIVTYFLFAFACTFLSNQSASAADNNQALKCDDIIQASKDKPAAVSKFDAMLIQVGLYHLNEEFQDYQSIQMRQQDTLKDGKVGPETIKALKEFCDSISEKQQNDVITSMFLYAALKTVEPNCEAVESVAVLNAWIKDREQDPVKAWAQDLLDECDRARLAKDKNVNQYFMLTQGLLDDYFVNILKAYEVEPLVLPDASEGLNADELAQKTTEAQAKVDAQTQALESMQAAAEEVAQSLAFLIDRPSPTQQAYTSEARKAVEGIKADNAFIQRNYMSVSTLVELTRTPIIIQPYPLQAADCDCLNDVKYNDVLYHFYPGFMGNAQAPKSLTSQLLDETEGEKEEQATPEKLGKIDYSIVSRIGFQGMSINRKGQIPSVSRTLPDGSVEVFEPLDLWQQQRNEFVKQAHQFYSQVDVVFELENWLIWDTKSIENAFSMLKERILINPKENGFYWSYSTRNNLDGLTFYFDNFEQDESHSLQMSRIVNAFLKLKDSHPDLHINIVLDLPLCTDAESCANISENLLVQGFNICDITVGGKPDSQDGRQRCMVTEEISSRSVDNILIFLPQQTTHSKKYLRRFIEERFKGEARSQMMNKVIPVIAPYPLDENNKLDMLQFEDDLIYAKHNFGGTGFWPMPLASDNDFDAMNTILNSVMIDSSTLSEAMSDPNQSNTVQIAIRTLVHNDLCKVLCTQRGIFRIIFDVFFVVMLATLLLRNASCLLCKLIDKHRVIYLSLWVVLIALFVSMLGCDRFWNNKADIALVLLMLFVGAVSIGRYVLSSRRSEDLHAISRGR